MSLLSFLRPIPSIETKDGELVIPQVIMGTGSMIYSEPDNPYERIEVYIEGRKCLCIKEYIFDNGDGAGSWKAVFLDKENTEKLKKITGGKVRKKIQSFCNKNNSMGPIIDYLEKNGIEYIHRYYL